MITSSIVGLSHSTEPSKACAKQSGAKQGKNELPRCSSSMSATLGDKTPVLIKATHPVIKSFHFVFDGCAHQHYLGQ
jgi:hypothetical protein